ncbi:hypothetical protein, partial [Staphylococcus aureus]|uniref:hypothetical protein n=1 Tax=Staphylococcus aureus TaxID=1280 RepID=UPI0038B3387E
FRHKVTFRCDEELKASGKIFPAIIKLDNHCRAPRKEARNTPQPNLGKGVLKGRSEHHLALHIEGHEVLLVNAVFPH